MGLLDQDVLDSLSIQRMIFHVVGPREEDLQLMDEIDATGYEEFFLSRVRETNVGNRFQFIGTDTGIRPALNGIKTEPSRFVQLSKEITQAFQVGHGATASKGAFIVAELSGLDRAAFALIKFDDLTVLRFRQMNHDGRVLAKVSEVDNTFIEDRKAMQKSALIVFNDEGGDLAVYDRTNKSNITDYFKAFLGVRRLWQPADATTRLIKALEQSARLHKDSMPDSIKSSWKKRLHEATQNRDTIEPGEDFEVFGSQVFGPFWQDQTFRADIDRELHSKRISGEVIEIDKSLIRLPQMRRLRTQENVLILYPKQLDDGATVVKVEKQGDGTAVITIRTQGITDDELTDEAANRQFEATRGRPS